jgi:hypothetical protein
LRGLAAYLVALQRNGRIERLESAEASSRLILETCAWFAMHRHFSPGGADIPNDVARRTVLTHLCAGFGFAGNSAHRHAGKNL